MATEIESLLDYVMNIGGTELIVTEGAPSAVRLAGKVCPIPDAPAVESGALREFLGSIEGESGAIIGGPWANSRWRVRYFRSALGNSAVFRPLMDECPNFADLGAPQTLNNLLGLSSGLVVFAGPACAGKTTTATSYVSALCESRMLRACLLDSAGEYPVRTGDAPLLASHRLHPRVVAVGSNLPLLDMQGDEVKSRFAQARRHFVVEENSVREHARRDTRIALQHADDVKYLRMEERLTAAERYCPHIARGANRAHVGGYLVHRLRARSG